jgi:predicted dehydrogenase
VSEKPLATTWDDFQTLRQSIRETRKSVVALLTTRMSPAFLAARNAVAEGRIGRPIFAFGQKSYPFATRDEYYRTRETYGGSIGWQAVHALDFVSWVAGREYARVAATLSNQAHPTHPGMEDAGGLILDFVGGGHATIAFDYLRPWPGGPDEKRTWGDDRLRIAGDCGVLEVEDEGSRTILLTSEGKDELPPPAPRDLVGEFLDYLAGRRDDEGLVTTAESLRITEVCLRARDAGDTGQFVELG